MSQILLLIPPAVAVASLIVHTLAFVAPVGLLRNFGLASITPTTTDGPRLWMGVLGSCARRNYSAHINCTRASLFPKYDLSVISKDDATLFEAATPSNVLAALICTSIVFTILFCILLAFRASALWTEEGVPSLSRKRVFDVVIIFTGLAGFLGGIIYAILSVAFNNPIKIFNEKRKTQNQIPSLIASRGGTFRLVWIGYVLLCISIIMLLLESHFTARKEVAKKAALPTKAEPAEEPAAV